MLESFDFFFETTKQTVQELLQQKILKKILTGLSSNTKHHNQKQASNPSNTWKQQSGPSLFQKPTKNPNLHTHTCITINT